MTWWNLCKSAWIMFLVNIINLNDKFWFKIFNKSNIKIFHRTDLSPSSQCLHTVIFVILEKVHDQLQGILTQAFAWKLMLRRHFASFEMHSASIHHHSWYVHRFPFSTNSISTIESKFSEKISLSRSITIRNCEPSPYVNLQEQIEAEECCQTRSMITSSLSKTSQTRSTVEPFIDHWANLMSNWFPLLSDNINLRGSVHC